MNSWSQAKCLSKLKAEHLETLWSLMWEGTECLEMVSQQIDCREWTVQACNRRQRFVPKSFKKRKTLLKIKYVGISLPPVWS